MVAVKKSIGKIRWQLLQLQATFHQYLILPMILMIWIGMHAESCHNVEISLKMHVVVQSLIKSGLSILKNDKPPNIAFTGN